MKTGMMSLLLLFSVPAFAAETRVDFSGQGAKTAFLRLQELSAKNDGITVSNGMGAVMLSSKNMDCRYSSDDSGNKDLKKADASRFSCFVNMDDEGNVGCANVCKGATKPGAAKAPKAGGR